MHSQRSNHRFISHDDILQAELNNDVYVGLSLQVKEFLRALDIPLQPQNGIYTQFQSNIGQGYNTQLNRSEYLYQYLIIRFFGVFPCTLQICAKQEQMRPIICSELVDPSSRK